MLYVPDETCLARLRKRNADGEHPFAAMEGQFHQFTGYYAPPSPEESFEIVVHGETG